MFLEEGGIVLSTSNWYGRRSRVEFKKKKKATGRNEPQTKSQSGGWELDSWRK